MQTIAREGAKHNILACTLATSLDGSVGKISSESVIEDTLRSIIALSHSSNHTETGHLYQVEEGRCQKLRWQRAAGAWQNPDVGLTSGSIKSQWAAINDFSDASYPNSSANFQAVVDKTKKLQHGPPGKDPRFDGKIVLVTGAGSG